MVENNNKAPFISEKRMKELLSFTSQNNLSYDNIYLLENAFTHSSYANEAKNDQVKDNERLEFLGDSVLSIVVSEWLYNNLEGKEGAYTKIRSLVVSEGALSEAALTLGLDKLLLMGHGEEITGGRQKKAILADCMEAVIASVFLDKGFLEAKNFVLSIILPIINKVKENQYKKDYKTALQEYVQKHYKKVPTYQLIRSEGPEHNQVFYYTVGFQGKIFGPEKGHNRKDAEQKAARLALTKLGLL